MAQLISFFVFIFLLLPPAGMAAVVEFDPSASSAEFLAVGRPSMMKIRGKDGKVQGKLDLAQKDNLGELTIDLDGFDTGIAMRNQHMKEKYLQTNDPSKKHAKLVVTKFEVPADLLKNGGKADLPFAGKLNFHGEQRDVSGILVTEVKGDKLTGTTKLQLNLSDYKVEIPSYLGIKVAETVDVEVSLTGKISSEPQKL